MSDKTIVASSEKITTSENSTDTQNFTVKKRPPWQPLTIFGAVPSNPERQHAPNKYSLLAPSAYCNSEMQAPEVVVDTNSNAKNLPPKAEKSPTLTPQQPTLEKHEPSVLANTNASSITIITSTIDLLLHGLEDASQVLQENVRKFESLKKWSNLSNTLTEEEQQKNDEQTPRSNLQDDQMVPDNEQKMQEQAVEHMRQVAGTQKLSSEDLIHDLQQANECMLDLGARLQQLHGYVETLKLKHETMFNETTKSGEHDDKNEAPARAENHDVSTVAKSKKSLFSLFKSKKAKK